jgi:ubiquinone/menaquinone biosynthesis C-methylase UbiE
VSNLPPRPRPGAPDGSILRRLYANRFDLDQDARAKMWRVLVQDYFQRWVPVDSTVLDLAAGDCAFINSVTARRRIAVDLNPAVLDAAGPGVEAYACRADEVSVLPDGSVDRVFVSNFFEHLSREAILAVLGSVRRILAEEGRLLVLQPNIRYCAKDYWMFFDHITPLDDRSLGEAPAITGFSVAYQVTRFLPYTTKSRLPSSPALVRAYLRIPAAWRIMGAQTFVVARRA